MDSNFCIGQPIKGKDCKKVTMLICLGANGESTINNPSNIKLMLKKMVMVSHVLK